jgi:hypothetical protein
MQENHPLTSVFFTVFRASSLISIWFGQKGLRNSLMCCTILLQQSIRISNLCPTTSSNNWRSSISDFFADLHFQQSECKTNVLIDDMRIGFDKGYITHWTRTNLVISLLLDDWCCCQAMHSKGILIVSFSSCWVWKYISTPRIMHCTQAMLNVKKFWLAIFSCSCFIWTLLTL